MALLAVAASLLVIAGYSWWLAPRDQVAPTAASSDPSIPAIDWTANRQVLAEYQNLFGSEFQWIIEQPARTEVGIRPSATTAPTPPGEFVVVRLMLMARPVDTNDWREVQRVNVVAQREEVVEIADVAGRHSSFALWAYPVEGGMISVDLRYNPSTISGTSPTIESISIESSSLQPRGRTTQIRSFVSGGVEYRLYQSADLLDGEDVG